MTSQEIARRLTSKSITPARVQKFCGLCWRMKVDEAAVLALLTEEQRKAVTGE